MMKNVEHSAVLGGEGSDPKLLVEMLLRELSYEDLIARKLVKVEKKPNGTLYVFVEFVVQSCS